MPATRPDLIALIGLVRLAFHRLRAAADGLHASRAISTPERGVLESLMRGGPQTVPQLAAARPVSRQFIQAQVDALLAKGLVGTQPNPRHKRSALIALTESGRTAFTEMLAAEAPVLDRLARELDAGDVAAARRALGLIVSRLDAGEPAKENENE